MGGRVFIRRLLDRFRNLKHPHHRVRLTRDMRADMLWWLSFVDVFNRKIFMVESRHAATAVSIDVCNDAAGAFYKGDCVYTPLNQAPRSVQLLPINYKEVMALEPAMQVFAPMWANQRVFVHSDNKAAVAIMKKGTCRDPVVIKSLRRVFWLMVLYNIRITPVYYPGVHNELADCVSRLHEKIAQKDLFL